MKSSVNVAARAGALRTDGDRRVSAELELGRQQRIECLLGVDDEYRLGRSAAGQEAEAQAAHAVEGRLAEGVGLRVAHQQHAGTTGAADDEAAFDDQRIDEHALGLLHELRQRDEFLVCGKRVHGGIGFVDGVLSVALVVGASRKAAEGGGDRDGGADQSETAASQCSWRFLERAPLWAAMDCDRIGSPRCENRVILVCGFALDLRAVNERACVALAAQRRPLQCRSLPHRRATADGHVRTVAM